jgi:predicted aconitase
MILAPDEQDMLEGKEGPTRQRAMELLLQYGEALGAERFVDTSNVTVLAGLFEYPELVDKNVPSLDADEVASLFFLDSKKALPRVRVKAFTTNHIFVINRDYWRVVQRRTPTLRILADRIEAYCKDIGINNLATCTPYQAGNVPIKGEHCAWTESSSIPFANAVLGARTNIEGCHSSFASALTGKTPLWGMHLDENRFGDFLIDVEIALENVMDWGLLGYYAGSVVGLHVPVYINISDQPNLSKLMSLNAAGAASGSIVMYHIVRVTPEAATLDMATGDKKPVASMKFGKEERAQAYEKLNQSEKEDVDIVVLGCPHYSLERIGLVSSLLDGKTISENTALYITTCKQIKTLADRNGYTDVISRAGGILMEDTCGLEFAHERSKSIATDSAKQAHYVPAVLGVENTFYGTTEDCIDAAIIGKWRGELK